MLLSAHSDTDKMQFKVEIIGTLLFVYYYQLRIMSPEKKRTNIIQTTHARPRMVNHKARNIVANHYT